MKTTGMKFMMFALLAALSFVLLQTCGESPTDPGPQATATPVPTQTPVTQATATPVPQATATATPVPVGFQDFEENNGTPDNVYFEDSTPPSNPALTGTQTYGGSARALVLTTGMQSAGGAVVIYSTDPDGVIDLSHVQSLYAWVFDNGVGGNALTLTVQDGRQASGSVVSTADGVHMTTQSQAWTLISWPVSPLSVDLSQVVRIRLLLEYDGTTYVDDLYAQ